MADGARRQWSLRIARIAGIELRVHVSFLLIVILFALDSNGVVSSLSWLAIIFACVTAHELAHSIVAQHRGIPVRSILLLPIGGVSQLERMPEEPRDEFRIAIVGPLTSVCIAAAAAAIALGAGIKLIPIDLYAGAIVHRLVWFNLLLGGFNLLPAFPLDGGRVFRALLERRLDRVNATHLASQIGRALAGGMFVVGLFFNLWLSIIGMFVFFGASAEESATITHAKLKGLLVRDVMLLDPKTVEAYSWMGDLHDLIRRNAQGEFPVVHDGTYVGLLSAAMIQSAPRNAFAGETADRDAPTLKPQQDVEDVLLRLMSTPAHAALCVLDRGTVIGLLRREDVVQALNRPVIESPHAA